MVLAQGGKAILAAREDLVGVGLVAHVPHDAVLEKVEVVEEGDGQLHGAEVGTEVAPRFRHGGNEEGPHFGREPFELVRREMADLLGGGQGIQQGIGADGSAHADSYFARWARYEAQAAKELRLGRDAR